MSQEGAVQAVVEILNSHKDSTEIMVVALSCLTNLARQEYNGSMIVREGALEGLAHVLRTLHFDAEVGKPCAWTANEDRWLPLHQSLSSSFLSPKKQNRSSLARPLDCFRH